MIILNDDDCCLNCYALLYFELTELFCNKFASLPHSCPCTPFASCPCPRVPLAFIPLPEQATTSPCLSLSPINMVSPSPPFLCGIIFPSPPHLGGLISASPSFSPPCLSRLPHIRPCYLVREILSLLIIGAVSPPHLVGLSHPHNHSCYLVRVVSPLSLSLSKLPFLTKSLKLTHALFFLSCHVISAQL